MNYTELLNLSGDYRVRELRVAELDDRRRGTAGDEAHREALREQPAERERHQRREQERRAHRQRRE